MISAHCITARRPFTDAPQTYIVVFSHCDAQRGDPSTFGAGASTPVGQTLEQACDAIIAAAHEGYCAEAVWQLDGSTRIGGDVTGLAAQRLEAKIGEWNGAAQARRIDEFCEDALGWSPLREMLRDAEESPTRRAVNSRAQHGGSLNALTVTLAALVGNVLWVGWLNGWAP